MRLYKKKIKLVIEKTETSYSAYSEQPAIFTTSPTIAELMELSLAKAKEHFDGRFEVTAENMRYELDFVQFFKHYKMLNIKFLAEKIGMNPTLLSHYALGHKKPSQSHAEKILTGICQIGKEWSEMILIYRS